MLFSAQFLCFTKMSVNVCNCLLKTVFKKILTKSCESTTVGSKIIGPPEFLPWDPMVNESHYIECCGNKMHQIVPNIMLYQYLELKRTLLRKASVSGYLPLF